MEQAKLLSFKRSSDQNGMRKTRLKDTDQILFNVATCQLQANVIPAALSTPFGNIDQEMIERKKWKERLFIYWLLSV